MLLRGSSTLIADNIKKIADKMPKIADKVSRTADRLFHHLENYLIKLHKQGKIPNGNFKYTANFFYSLLSSILVFQLTLPYINEYINPDIDEMIDEVVHLFTVSLYNPRERNKSK